ncbi:MAG: ribonuclease Y [Kiritimatiellae bacterium]|nr:ribonuclease Y [Kiritimatiellia bacterium]
MTPIVLSLVAGLLLGAGFGWWLRAWTAARSAPGALRGAQTRLSDAERTAKNMVREAEIQAKSEVLKAREAFETSVKEQRRELNETMAGLNKREASLAQREQNMDSKADILDRKEEAIDRKAAEAEQTAAEGRRLAKEAEKLGAEATAKLEKLAGMTRDQARRDLLEKAKSEIEGDVGTLIRRARERTEDSAAKEAQKIVVGAMQRYAASHIADTAVKIVSVQGDDAKGRIIGREGRNIRALEAATGCSFIIDDIPDGVIISAADPLRREIAATALERLIASGKIQPQKIEEEVESVKRNWDEHLAKIGGSAADEAGVAVADDETLRTLGKLRFRVSFSQNVLRHSVEVARYAGMMASELGLDAQLARRIGLFHDIGKALDETHEGPHAAVGAAFLGGRGERKEVLDGVAGHHGETGDPTVYAALVSVADAMSSARPGARSETGEIYIGRMSKLEQIASAFPGVERAFAYQAGRDLRVFVDPEKASDTDALVLARDICAKVEKELQFTGQIKITVIREKRCVEYAR